MEFWGVEVKAGQPLKVKPTFDNIIHLSQASLAECKKDKKESVCLYVKSGDQTFVAGTLLSDTIPQLQFDLVFEKEFELSHNWKNGSVFFLGYQTPLPQDDSDEFDMEDSEEEEMELPTIPAENGKAAPKAEKAKAPAAPAAKAPAVKQGKVVKPKEDDDSESDDEDDSDDDMLEVDSDEISGKDEGSDEDEDDSEDEGSDEDEETPKKAQAGKKRPVDSATKTPISSKKAKTATPDGKKGGHVSTPHPSKGAKTPNDKAQTPKSGGQISCKSCSKSFGSDGALQSHAKAKHSGK